MKNLLHIIIFLIPVLFNSCEDLHIINCSDCFIDEPVTGDVEIKLEAESTSRNYLIEIYLGKIDDGIIIDSFYSSFSTSRSLILNTEYTFSATLRLNGITYISIDSTVPKTYRSEDSCDEICYIVVDNVVNLKLKHL